jgi:hypothetical protein
MVRVKLPFGFFIFGTPYLDLNAIDRTIVGPPYGSDNQGIRLDLGLLSGREPPVIAERGKEKSNQQ